MKMTMKKLVALTLALCMIVAVIPAGLAADLDYTGEEYKLWFGRNDATGGQLHGGGSYTVAKESQHTEANPYVGESYAPVADYSDGTSTNQYEGFGSTRWKFYTLKGGSRIQFGCYAKETGGARVGLNNGGYFALTVKLPAAGKYTMQLAQVPGMDATSVAQKVAVYMLPADGATTAADAQAYVDEMMMNETLLGVVDLSDSDTNPVKSFAKLDIDEDMAGTDVILVIKVLRPQTVSSGWGAGQMFLQSIVFNGKSDAAAIDYTVTDLSATASFTTEVSSGYYADTKDAAEVEGTIAINAFYNEYAKADSFGIYVYQAGNEEGKIALRSNNITALAEEVGKFYALVSAIDAANFEDTVVAIPFAEFDGMFYYGDPAIASVDADNYLGAKPVVEEPAA